MRVITLWHQGIDRLSYITSSPRMNPNQSTIKSKYTAGNNEKQVKIGSNLGAQNFLEGCVTDMGASASGTGFVPHCHLASTTTNLKRPKKQSSWIEEEEWSEISCGIEMECTWLLLQLVEGDHHTIPPKPPNPHEQTRQEIRRNAASRTRNRDREENK